MERRPAKGKEKVIDEDVYRPSLDVLNENDNFDFATYLEDNRFYEFFEDTYDPEHQAESEGQVGENVENKEDESRVDDECPLHNEGVDDGDDEVDHFISLASMCRDEQLFSNFYQQISKNRESVVVDDETTDANHIPSIEAPQRPSSNGSKTPQILASCSE